jgi:hypothetical protein
MSDYKVNDPVIVSTNYGVHLDKVVLITPAGNIKTKKSGLYYPDGYERTSDPWRRNTIRKATEQDIQRIENEVKRRQIVRILRNSVEYENMSLTSLQSLLKLIREEQEANPEVEIMST